VCAYKKHPRRFRAYIGNVRYIAQALGETHVAYYEDIITDPKAMWDVLSFLDIDPKNGKEPLTLARLHAEWDEASALSRDMYDVNQHNSGGATTRTNPTDFSFHQRTLTRDEKAFAWKQLDKSLNAKELSLLYRYRPAKADLDLGWVANLKVQAKLRKERRASSE
jgi:hypothetical protein